MAKVKFLGDPSGEEHRESAEHAGITLPLGEFVKMPDQHARKLANNPHFEVQGLRAPVQSEDGAPSNDEIEALSAQLTQAMATVADLQSQLDERGQMLTVATQRIAELEAQLTPPAEQQ